VIADNRKDSLLGLLEPSVEALGYELVDLDVQTGWRGVLRIYIDKEEGIELADCELVSRQLSDLLDVEDPLPGHYVLEVSSPGIERRLRTLEHFKRFCGLEVVVQLKAPKDGLQKLRGRILEVQEEVIVIKGQEQSWTIELIEVELARLLPVN
tara:strand:- start:2289 stop:2747 length:459 start_codon:yes stop_codon:yes gene_type:complete